MPAFSDKKIRAQYPTTEKQYSIDLARGYNDSDVKGKFIVFLSPSGTVELWESQLDMLLPIASQMKFKGILKVTFIDVGTAQKQKLVPKVQSEEL